MNETLSRARRSLSRRDPVLRQLIRTVGPCTLSPDPDHFGSLVRAIVAQQISTRAAASIFGRVVQDACRGCLNPTTLANADDATLRRAGLSATKARYVRTLAERVHDGTLALAGVGEREDEVVIEQLVALPGIGRWTAQMFLIFSLGRLDVLPVDDFGLRNGARRHYGLEEMPGKATLEEMARKWRPYSSVATWYIWRSQGPVPRSD